MNPAELMSRIEQRWPERARCSRDDARAACEVACDRGVLAALCGLLFGEWGFAYAGLIVEEESSGGWRLLHCFYDDGVAGWVRVVTQVPAGEATAPSIVAEVCAADWHEREVEDLFGLHFSGHPRLGDFILHDDAWQEDVAPMRRGFDARAALASRRPAADWRPRRVLEEPGAFAMPVGPKYSGVTESVHFLLETVGEDVTRCIPRLFYKWRAVEKLAEGRTIDDALLLAERFAATTAFAHGLAFCQAVETVCGARLPTRARRLRVFLAELERLRQHAGAIQEICESTALAVAGSQAGIFEEELLRITGELCGHRYLFGLLAPGGLRCDLDDGACRKALDGARGVLGEIDGLERQLRKASSFLDRLEEVGFVSLETARNYGLLGPVARASGLVRDLRRAQPYSGYEGIDFDVPCEREGDGYARLRVLFAEARQSVRIMEQAAAAPDGGSVRAAVAPAAGAALGWVEAPRGGAFHWVRLDGDGRVARHRIVPPSFANWHGLHLAVERFAFQDFPIILSTFDLSAAENDR